LRAQRLGDDIDVGEQIVNVGHHPAHDAEPCMVVCIDQAGQDDASGGIDDFGVIGLQVGADGHDAVALDQDVAGCEIGNVGVHRDDGAALKKDGACSARHGELL